MTINKEDNISEVIEAYPETLEVFSEYWLWCVWCHIAAFESIEEWAMAHWFNEEETANLVNDLNESQG